MYIVLDLETTIKHTFKRVANQFDPDNKIVASGTKKQNDSDVVIVFGPGPADLVGYTTVVGHNIKFDMLYLWKFPEFQKWLLSGGRIWDTQLVEYIITGQEFTRDYNAKGTQTAMHSLRGLASKKYGQPEREKLMEPYWEKQICTSKIPTILVRQDLLWDVLDTEAILKKQFDIVNALEQMPLIKTQMDALLSTTEMEFNGIYVNQNVLNKERNVVLEDLISAKIEIQKIAGNFWQLPVEFNCASNNHISLLLFGGKLISSKREQVGVFKNGNLRFKNIKYELIQPPLCTKSSLMAYGTENKKQGFYSVDEYTLNKIARNSRESEEVIKLCQLLLNQRNLAKEVSTYYNSMEELTMEDGCVHHKLLHVVTNTGRLSSRDPNLQNIPRKENSNIKKVFTSRFGDGGVILEFDYKQLEVKAAAVIFNDPVLIAEMNSGVDIYIENAIFLYGTREITKAQRQILKAIILGILYGKGPRSLSIDTGLTFENCMDFIKSFYDKYVQIAFHHQLLISTVQNNKTVSDKKSTSGRSVGKSVYKSLTGRLYTFYETDSPKFLQDKGIMVSFNPPDIKNYPIQGFATADIVPMMVGRLFRFALQHREKGLLINTVHDSIMLDVKLEHLDFWIKNCTAILENVPQALKENFNIDTDVKFDIDCKYGSSWWDC